jgi:hypothetical protein
VSNDTMKDGERVAQVAVIVKDLIETLMLWNGQASAGLDVRCLAGLRDELVSIVNASAAALTTEQIDAIREQFHHDEMPSRGMVQRIATLVRAPAPQASPLSVDDETDACFRRNLDLKIVNLTVSDENEVTWIVVSCRGVESSLEVVRDASVSGGALCNASNG